MIDWGCCTLTLDGQPLQFRNSRSADAAPGRLSRVRAQALPANLVLPRPPEVTPRDVPQCVRERQGALQAVQPSARTHLQQSANGMEIRYDREDDREPITEGVAVWYSSHRQPTPPRPDEEPPEESGAEGDYCEEEDDQVCTQRGRRVRRPSHLWGRRPR